MSTAVEMIQQVASGAAASPSRTDEALLRLDQVRQKVGSVQLSCDTVNGWPSWRCAIINTFSSGCPRVSGYGGTLEQAIEHALQGFTAGQLSISGEELSSVIRPQQADPMRHLVDEFCTLHDCHWLGAIQTGEPA